MGGHVVNSTGFRLGVNRLWSHRYTPNSSYSLLYNIRLINIENLLSQPWYQSWVVINNILLSHVKISLASSRLNLTYYLYDGGYEFLVNKIFGYYSFKKLSSFYLSSLFRSSNLLFKYYKQFGRFAVYYFRTNVKYFNCKSSSVLHYDFLQKFTKHLVIKKFFSFYLFIFNYYINKNLFKDVYSNKKPRQTIPIVLRIKDLLIAEYRKPLYTSIIFNSILFLHRLLLNTFSGGNRVRRVISHYVFRITNRRRRILKLKYVRLANIKQFLRLLNVQFFNLNQFSVTSQLLSRFVVYQLRLKLRISEIIYPMLRMISPFLTGIKVIFSGRFTRAPRAAYLIIQRGKVPLNTLWHNIDYFQYNYPLKFGECSVKIWICKYYGFFYSNYYSNSLNYNFLNYSSMRSPFSNTLYLVEKNRFSISHPYKSFF